MKESKFNIETEINGNNVIYNTNTLAMIELDKNISEIHEKEELDILYENGFLVDDDIVETEFIVNDFLNITTKNETLYLSIITTMDCNFECPYCFQNRKREYFTEETSKAVINFFMRQIFHELGHAKYQATIKPIKYKILEIPNSLIDDETVGILFEKFILYNPIIKNQLENFLELEIDLFSQFDPSKRIYSPPIKDDIFNIFYVLTEEDLFSNKSITTIKEDFNDRLQELNLDINNLNIYADPHWFYGDFGYYIAYIEAKFRAADIYNNLIKIGIKDTNSLKKNIEFCFSSISKYLELGKNVNGNIVQYLLSRNTDYNEYFKWLDENKNLYSK